MMITGIVEEEFPASNRRGCSIWDDLKHDYGISI